MTDAFEDDGPDDLFVIVTAAHPTILVLRVGTHQAAHPGVRNVVFESASGITEEGDQAAIAVPEPISAIAKGEYATVYLRRPKGCLDARVTVSWEDDVHGTHRETFDVFQGFAGWSRHQ